MKAVILSITTVSDTEVQQVKDILRVSKCPNESLKRTFPARYHDIEDKCPYGRVTVYFDGGADAAVQKTEIEY